MKNQLKNYKSSTTFSDFRLFLLSFLFWIFLCQFHRQFLLPFWLFPQRFGDVDKRKWKDNFLPYKIIEGIILPGHQMQVKPANIKVYVQNVWQEICKIDVFPENDIAKVKISLLILVVGLIVSKKKNFKNDENWYANVTLSGFTVFQSKL